MRQSSEGSIPRYRAHTTLGNGLYLGRSASGSSMVLLDGRQFVELMPDSDITKAERAGSRHYGSRGHDPYQVSPQEKQLIADTKAAIAAIKAREMLIAAWLLFGGVTEERA